MSAGKETFEYKGAKITVQKPNGFSQTRLWRLHRLLNIYGSEEVDRDDAISMTFYLANTVAIEGAVGFPVPVSNATHPELMAFVRGLGQADAELLKAWDNAVSEAIAASNDPDLLPPEELSQKKGKTPASS